MFKWYLCSEYSVLYEQKQDSHILRSACIKTNFSASVDKFVVIRYGHCTHDVSVVQGGELANPHWNIRTFVIVGREGGRLLVTGLVHIHRVVVSASGHGGVHCCGCCCGTGTSASASSRRVSTSSALPWHMATEDAGCKKHVWLSRKRVSSFTVSLTKIDYKTRLLASSGSPVCSECLLRSMEQCSLWKRLKCQKKTSLKQFCWTRYVKYKKYIFHR